MPAAAGQAIPAFRGNPADMRLDVIGEGAPGAFAVLGITARDKIINGQRVQFVFTEGTPNLLSIAVTDITSGLSITANDQVTTSFSLVDSFALIRWVKHPRGGA